MKGFTIIYSDSVRNSIKRLPKNRQIQIVTKLGLIPANPELLDIVKMAGREDTYRIRIGEYRAIFVVDFVNRLVKIDKLDTRGKIEKFY